jgi:hypothetical protein
MADSQRESLAEHSCHCKELRFIGATKQSPGLVRLPRTFQVLATTTGYA